MEIEGQYGFYSEEEQKVIGRGEMEKLPYLEHDDLYAKFNARRREFDARRSADDELTPDINAQLLYEGKALRDDKLIVDGVASQLMNWQLAQPDAHPQRGQV